ncbi:MAG TPA: GNAT family N-acetyltransferase [Bacteroidia bacterium]|jgi:N-acetylglutamate synthase-like GNAT family acetyltransferase
MAGTVIRNYKTEDKEEVLHLLRSNIPRYFAPEEEKDLVHYLEHEIESYFVIVMDERIAGCGGYNFSDNKKTGILSWDFLHPDFQGMSLGSELVKFRVKLLRSTQVEKIIVRTSQFAWKFYEKQGFKLIEKAEDYWAKGYHMYKMEYHFLNSTVI